MHTNTIPQSFVTHIWKMVYMLGQAFYLMEHKSIPHTDTLTSERSL